MRHIGIGGDEPATRDRVGPHLQQPAASRHPLIQMRQRTILLPQPGRPLLRNPALAQRTTLERTVDHRLQRSARREVPARCARHLGRHPVGGHDPAIRPPQHDAVADVRQHRVHLGGAAIQARFGFHKLRHVGDDADVPAIGQMRGADVDRGPVRPPPPPHQRHGTRVAALGVRDPRRIAIPILASLCAPVDHLVDGVTHLDRGALHDAVIRGVDQAQPPVRPIDADAMRNVAHDAGHQLRVPPQLRLRLHHAGDVADDADVAAIRQRRGADFDRAAIRAHPVARLRHRHVEAQLSANIVLGLARPILPRLRAPADHLLLRFPHIGGRAVHDLAIRFVDHRDPAVRAVNRHAMRQLPENAVQQARPAARLVLRLRQWRDVGHRHAPSAIRQWVGRDVEHCAIRAHPAKPGRPAAVHPCLVRQERRVGMPRELPPVQDGAQHAFERGTGRQLRRRQAQQRPETGVVQRQRPLRREHRDTDPKPR